MGTTITLSTGTLSVTITGDQPYIGPTYDRLVDWQGTPSIDMAFVKRPGAPGAFAPVQTFPDEAVISIEGSWFSADRAAGIANRETLAALYNDGKPITMTVTDDLRTTSREVMVEAVTIPWTIHPEFEYSIDVRAADPRRYGVATTAGSTLATTVGGGFTYPTVYPINYGSIGVDGRFTLVNDGNTSASTRYVVSGGSMPDGFVIVNVDTGERITYIGPVTDGTTVTVDEATRAAFINGTAPGSRYLSSPQWWSIPARSSRTIQFLARGAVTGTPRLDAYTASAYY
jgi:hypothetical protein